MKNFWKLLILYACLHSVSWGASCGLLAYNPITNQLDCTGTGSTALSAITAAGASNTIANGNNPQIWNWAQTSNTQAGMTFGETSAATGGTLGNQYMVKISGAVGSTAVPLLVANSLSGSQTLPALHITPTWNTTGVVDAALLINPTNTASGTGSLLADFQLGGTSQWKVDKAGNSTQTGSVTTGSVSGVAGAWQCLQGTAATVQSNAFGWTCPTAMTTSVLLQSPNAVPAANQIMLFPAPTSNVSQFTWTNFALSSIGAASASTTFADGNNPVTFNCAQTTNTQNCLTFGETSAATNGTLTNALANQLEVGISTASASTAAPLGVTQGSVTGTTGPPAVQIQSTWNNASLVGEGILENVTNTTSAAASKLLDLRVGNTAQMTVDKAGNTMSLTSIQTTATAPACTAGTAGAWCATEGTAFTNVASTAGIYPDSTAHEFLAKTNGASSTGMLTRAQPGAVSLTGQTAAIANGTALCAAAAGACNTAGLYRVTFYLACSATGTGSIGPTITYTDEVGAKTAQTVPISVAGSATLATTMALSATTQNATGTIAFWSTGAAQIGYGVTDSGTGTYSVRAVVERVGL